MTSATRAKADRLLAEDRVHAIPARTYAVEGDHGTYLVMLADDGLFHCTCPAVAYVCSHVLAARSLLAQALGREIPKSERAA